MEIVSMVKTHRLYDLIRIRVLVILYTIPFFKEWAYKRLPRHRSGYTHYWIEDKEYVNTMKAKQGNLAFLDTNPTTEELRKQIDSCGGKTVLELGMGWGRQLERLAPFYEVSGCDVAREYVDDCDSRGLDVFHLDLVQPVPIEKKWDVAYTILVYCFFIDRPDEMRKAMQTAESLVTGKIFVWEWRHVCDYMKKVYPSDKFVYQYVSTVKGLI